MLNYKSAIDMITDPVGTWSTFRLAIKRNYVIKYKNLLKARSFVALFAKALVKCVAFTAVGLLLLSGCVFYNTVWALVSDVLTLLINLSIVSISALVFALAAILGFLYQTVTKSESVKSIVSDVLTLLINLSIASLSALVFALIAILGFLY